VHLSPRIADARLRGVGAQHRVGIGEAAREIAARQAYGSAIDARRRLALVSGERAILGR
jgi:hypothetical protein